MAKAPLWKQLDEQYRKSRHNWRKPSPAFVSHSERFKIPRPITDATYDPQDPKVPATVWSKYASPQRPSHKATTDAIYNVPVAIGRESNSAATMSSRTTRFTDPELADGQQKFGIVESQEDAKRAAGSTKPFIVGNRSSLPQRPPVKPPVGTTDTETHYKTMEAGAGRRKKGDSAWAKLKGESRAVYRAKTDVIYDLPTARSQVSAGAPFTSRTPRLVEPPETGVPPVGTYTSPLIGSGMLE